MDAKLQEVIAGKAPEYLEPLAALQENMQIRTKVAGRRAKGVLLFQQYNLDMHFKVNLLFSLELLKECVLKLEILWHSSECKMFFKSK